MRAVRKELCEPIVDPRMAPKTVARRQHAWPQSRRLRAPVPRPTPGPFAPTLDNHRQRQDAGWTGNVQRYMRGIFARAIFVAPANKPNRACFHGFAMPLGAAFHASRARRISSSETCSWALVRNSILQSPQQYPLAIACFLPSPAPSMHSFSGISPQGQGARSSVIFYHHSVSSQPTATHPASGGMARPTSAGAGRSAPSRRQSCVARCGIARHTYAFRCGLLCSHLPFNSRHNNHKSYDQDRNQRPVDDGAQIALAEFHTVAHAVR